MVRVAVIGCGVVGATIAYELSQISGLEIAVFDRQAPAQASTKAALGVLMGAISQKLKGKNLRMRLTSIQHYNRLIPELEERTGQRIPFNHQGILRLCFDGEKNTDWQTLAEVRRSQGWHLDILNPDQLRAAYPYIHHDTLTGAVYSPDDRQVDPVALTLALVEAAQQNQVRFHFGVDVEALVFDRLADSSSEICSFLQTAHEKFAVDWVVIAAGLGTTPLIEASERTIDIRPVLGQALRLRLPQPLSNHPQPVVTGQDIHIVPLEEGEYWVGATVEFPDEQGAVVAKADQLESVLQGAIAFCPALAEATIVHTWSGLRPRPEGRPAPVIEPLPGYSNVLLATGHYRNGVLLAPATAQIVRETIVPQQP